MIFGDFAEILESARERVSGVDPGSIADWVAALATILGFFAVFAVYRGETMRLKRDQADQIFFNVQYYSNAVHFSVENTSPKRISDTFFLIVEPSRNPKYDKPVAKVLDVFPPDEVNSEVTPVSSYFSLNPTEKMSTATSSVTKATAKRQGAVAFKDAHNRRWVRLFAEDECLPVSYSFFEEWSQKAEAKHGVLPKDAA
ncbi:hypothetical protein [Rathayibacter sp. PhB151]|uniref:hypothetical protein n=1 Tax=Rathayibacter sp. PhB151 TaxID=2485189 RepID=UPI00106353CC|nr:hypothetical protein [Rathayibacter sp. PhB151]